MNRNQAKELLPIIKAFSEGKDVEYFDEGSDKWRTCELPQFDYNVKYRISPEQKYRPFASAEECWQEMLKHQPFGWVKYQCSFFYIIYIEDKMIGYGSACGTILHDNFKDTLKGLTFVDGTPFGVKVDEED